MSTNGAWWNVTLPEGVYRIEFEHGTASGRRVLRVNGKELFRKDWMFRLVGPELFHIGRHQFTVDVEPSGPISFNYLLSVDGCSLEEFRKKCKRTLVVWRPQIGANMHRVVLEKETMDVWVDGHKLEDPKANFTEEGSEICFSIESSLVQIRSQSSGDKRLGMIYDLTMNDCVVEVCKDE